MLALAAVGLVLAGAKLSVRSVATGEAVVPIAGAPVLGPGNTPTPTPGPPRSRVRVQVTDPAGQPVALALVELRDRFNAVAASQETGPSGEAFLSVPVSTGYSVTARREGFSPGMAGPVNVERPVTVPGPGTPVQAPAQLIQVRLEPAARVAGTLLSRLFVGHTTTPRLSLVDAASSLLLKHSDPLGQGRLTLQAPARDASKVYATWSGSPDLWVLSGTDLTVERQVQLNGGPISALAVNPKDGRLWVATFAPDSTETGTLHEVDTVSWDVLRRINMGQMTAGMRFRPDGAVLFARHRSSTAVSFIEVAAGSVFKTARLAQWPTDMAVSPDGSRLFMVFLSSERLMEMDAHTAEMGRTIEVGTGASGVVPHPDGKRVFVVNQLLGSVQLVDLAVGQVTDLIPVGRAPQGAILARSGLYVANSGSGSISVIDPDKSTVRETLSTGGTPSSLTLIEQVG